MCTFLKVRYWSDISYSREFLGADIELRINAQLCKPSSSPLDDMLFSIQPRCAFNFQFKSLWAPLKITAVLGQACSILLSHLSYTKCSILGNIQLMEAAWAQSLEHFLCGCAGDIAAAFLTLWNPIDFDLNKACLLEMRKRSGGTSMSLWFYIAWSHHEMVASSMHSHCFIKPC